jgi:hypothetical protein
MFELEFYFIILISTCQISMRPFLYIIMANQLTTQLRK